MGKRKNLLVVGIIAILAIGLLLVGLLNRPSSGTMVLITVGGEEYGRYPLNTPREVLIDLGDGESNTLVIDGGGFYMKNATCRDQRCVEQGRVTPDNISERMLGTDIICLPHQVVVSLVTENTASAINNP